MLQEVYALLEQQLVIDGGSLFDRLAWRRGSTLEKICSMCIGCRGIDCSDKSGMSLEDEEVYLCSSLKVGLCWLFFVYEQRKVLVSEQNPVRHVDGHSPVRHVDEHKPVRNVDEHNPVRHVDEHNPVRNVDEHNSVRHVDAHNPVRHVDEHNPVRNVDEHNPVRYVDEHNPVRNVD
ncbi:involucrin-like [Elysia marginata]|uniref:Involucrin-like n=1 Tax=Elysia marginata TaxID=1093978 RepID=A0AAV4JMB3_9GAST|nr:involucrin-like [Elysia marginata]